MRRWTAIILLTASAGFGGCRRHEPPPAPPATQVSVAPPATQPVVAPLPAIFVISGQSFAFPPCKLVTKDRDGGRRVTLFSIDPPEAVREGYTGNSFYFRFALDGDATDDLAGQQYVFRNGSAEQGDDANGLFIAGGRQALRPVDAVVGFDRVDRQIIVTVGGTFRIDDAQTVDAPPAIVKAQAMLEPLIADAKR